MKMVVFIRGTNETMLIDVPDFKPQVHWFGTHGDTEIHVIAIGAKRGRVIAVGVGKRHDKEGTKTIWKHLEEFEQFEVPLPS